jgi:hypothetical protein
LIESLLLVNVIPVVANWTKSLGPLLLVEPQFLFRDSC